MDVVALERHPQAPDQAQAPPRQTEEHRGASPSYARCGETARANTRPKPQAIRTDVATALLLMAFLRECVLHSPRVRPSANNGLRWTRVGNMEGIISPTEGNERARAAGKLPWRVLWWGGERWGCRTSIRACGGKPRVTSWWARRSASELSTRGGGCIDTLSPTQVGALAQIYPAVRQPDRCYSREYARAHKQAPRHPPDVRVARIPAQGGREG